MNKNAFIIILSICLLFINCKDDEISIDELIFDPDVSSSKVELGGQVVFTDYSTGVKSRLWTFPGGTPETSTDEEVSVSFSKEGPVTVKVEVTFLDDFTETKEFIIQVGNELYRRNIFGFEDATDATEAWGFWVSDDSDAMVFSVENSLQGGADGTDGFAKITINKANVESQLYTKGNTEPFNGILESNKTYEFSFYVKSDDFDQFTAAEVSNENQVQSWYNFAWYSPIREITSDWSYKTVTFQTGDLTQTYAEGFANNAWAQFKFLQNKTGVLYIDEVSLKEIPL
jgi:hypothetical protein